MFTKDNIFSRILIPVTIAGIFLLSSNAFSQENYNDWKYSTDIVINTSISPMSSSVTDFPLLVRLNSSNFNFSMAKRNGEDIRFSNSSNAHLSYEIERWDSLNGLAEIWVLVDNVLANNSAQYIIMYWGKADAADLSNSEAVFDATDNFAAVWHLAQSDFSDATSNNNDGTNSGSTEAAGMIGSGKTFNGLTNYINAGSKSSLDNINTLTVSAWIYADGWGENKLGRIVDKGGKLELLLSNTTYLQTFGLTRYRTTPTNYRALDGTLGLSQWYYVTSVMNGTSGTDLYKNNSETSYGVAKNNGSGALTSDAGDDLYIGNNSATDRTFDGKIDELRIESVCRSADWIKLCYETQNSSQTVVTLNPGNDAPTNITLSASSIDENQSSGTFVCTLATTDPDAGDGHNYSLVSGSGDSNNTCFTIINDTLKTAVMFDFEIKNRYGIRIRTTDKGALYCDKVFTITVIDQNIIPVITSTFHSDTIIPMGGSLTSTGSATGEPAPDYTWYFQHPDSSSPVIVGNNKVFTLSGATKADSGSYFMVASNIAGSDASDPVFVHVRDPVSIKLDLPSNYIVRHGGAAMFSIGVEGDGLISYQWYENGLLMSSDTNSSFSIDTINSAIHDGNAYYCIINNTFLGITVGTAASKTCKLIVSSFYNPFRIEAERINPQNTNQVRIKLWSDVDISDFQSTTSLLDPWADSVWIMYKTNGYATTDTEATVALYSTQSIKDAAPDSLIHILDVAPLQAPHDSYYWFSYTVRWHRPDTLLHPFTEANKLFMVDTLKPENPLVVWGEYFPKSDSARLIIDSILKLETLEDSLVIIQCSKDLNFNLIIFDDTLSASALIAEGKNRDTLIAGSLGQLPIETDTVFCRWYVKKKNGFESEVGNSNFMIGWDRPVYKGALLADSASWSNKMHLSWDSPVGGADSIRIWFNNEAIPLEHDIPLTIDISQAFYVSTVDTVDTLSGLSNSTLYFFGLQIFRDDMWSYVTEMSRTSAMTTHGLDTTVVNIIEVDTAWFNDTTKKIMIQWRIDLSALPSGLTYESGFTFTTDFAIDTAIKPVKWDSVPQAVNITKISLGQNIVFDTVYTVGMWLRGVSATLGPSQPSPPTYSSTYKLRIPSFTWEIVTFFPTGVCTVYAANEKIIFKEINHFTVTDTIWAYQPPQPLPAGLVNIKSVSFYFGNEELQVLPFSLGLAYGALPAGITKDDLGMYQVVEGQICVIYGFEAEDSVVWATVDINNMMHPFLILADTAAPVVTIEPYSDTVPAGCGHIPVWFTISDNIANVQWQFIYGSGDKGYNYGESGFLSSYIDSLKKFIKDTFSVISVFGVRALITANDGVNSDTINISRCVRTLQSDAISIVNKEWIPLRVTAGLNETSLERIFDISIIEDQAWEYDISRNRIFRWYNNDPVAPNNWMEYSDTVKQYFNFVPGRLIWCKTAENQTIKFGEGVTVTLKEAYEIPLKPKNWTDLSLPFKFPVMLRDILEATGTMSDSIDFYHWDKGGTSYEAVDIYIASLDSIENVTDTIISQPNYDGYTVYNHSQYAVTLRIPPISLPLSGNRLIRERAVEGPRDAWDISFLWKDKANEAYSDFRRLRCGYNKNAEGKIVFGLLPPTMSKTVVGIFDTSSNRICGWALQNSLKNGGMVFEIAFKNSSRNSADIEYHLDNLSILPENFDARILDPDKLKYENCSDKVTSGMKLSSKKSSRRMVVIGTDDYFDLVIKWLTPIKFALLKAYPNPFNSRIKIHYRVPAGIKEMRFTLYNVLGRTLWKGVQRKNLTPGDHLFIYHGKTGRNKGSGRLSSGMYIMRLTAVNKAGKVVYGGKRRIICVR